MDCQNSKRPSTFAMHLVTAHGTLTLCFVSQLLITLRYLYEAADYRTLETIVASGRDACKKLGDQAEALRVYGNFCTAAAASYENRGFFEEAEAYQRECLECRLKSHGEEAVADTASAYRRLSLIDEGLGRLDQYYQNRDKAVEIVNDIPSSSPQPYWMLEWNCSLARVLIRQGKYSEAEAHLQNLVATFEGTSKWYITSL